MEQQIIKTNQDSMDNLDFSLFSNSTESPLPSEEISTYARYDYNTADSFYEIDVADLNMTLYPDQLFNDLLADFKAIQQLSPSSPILDEINELCTEVFHSTESNDTANPIQSTDEQLAMIKSSGGALPVIRSHIGNSPIKSALDQSILLSNSVAVTVPTPNQLQLVYPLEDTYRPRYKSDYFPQNGTVRRPRYISDNAGHHFITLQMPAEYNNRIFTNEYIRVALITTSIGERGHFYSPYKFQTNHNDVKVPDQNPIYIPVQIHPGTNLTMRLHLVLIKSKLDQLHNAQPLITFSDSIGTIQNIINQEKLPSKDLINQYQLEKSHIAFTLCTKLSDGSYKIHPETTIISSIITESSTKLSATSNNKSESTKINNEKKVSCPNCQHCFDLHEVESTKEVKKRKSNGSTSRTNSKSTSNNRMNKKKKTV